MFLKNKMSKVSVVLVKERVISEVVQPETEIFLKRKQDLGSLKLEKIKQQLDQRKNFGLRQLKSIFNSKKGMY